MIYSLPLQLVFHHLRKNLWLVVVWFIFLAAFSGGIGKIFGIQYLFLEPEYQGKVSFWAFFILGMAFGILVVSFNITSYILDGHHFPFIGALKRPFAKFSVNNSLLPFIVLIVYLLAIIRFHLNNSYVPGLSIFLFALGLTLGIASMTLLLMGYFVIANKDIFRLVASNVDRRLRKSPISRQRIMTRFRETRQADYPVRTYLDLKLRPGRTSEIAAFSNREAVLRVFDQNHFNSVVLALVIIGVILLLGFFVDYPILQIPAAASALIMFSILIMLAGAISFWFKKWGLAFALTIFILANIMVKNGLGKGINQAAGLVYDGEKADYTTETLLDIHSKEQYVHDRLHMIETLERWRKKWPGEKRKMIFLCVSGGGQRAVLWTVNALINADGQLNGRLMDQAFLITGASGGLIGAAYYREAFRREKLAGNENEMIERAGKDNLNPVIFSLLANDLLVKTSKFHYGRNNYFIDRGHIFERTLNKNLGGIFSMTISDYGRDERNARVPTLIISPTIANDGRKLFISSHPVSYLGVSREHDDADLKIKGVDFQALFSGQGASGLSFLSALRMSASFPYITPIVGLPSNPRIEIMDAGISDNFGVSIALDFIYVFQEWIEKNTDGVIILIIRDSKPNPPLEGRPVPSIVERITYPIASVYKNISKMQNITNDVRIEVAEGWFDAPFDVVEITYDHSQNKDNGIVERRASLNWHLTAKEKKSIIENIHSESNQNALKKLKRLAQ